MSDASPTGETFLVIGGTGFLGHNIASALLSRGESKVHILDLRSAPAHMLLEKAKYHTGDITRLDDLNKVFEEVRPRVVFHTASPLPGVSKEVMEKVNVGGTSNVVEACKANNVRKLVFTSSASVVFNGLPLRYGDERLPYPERVIDPYSDTKAKGEKLVLDANTPDDEETGVPKEGLRTASVRPSGIFG